MSDEAKKKIQRSHYTINEVAATWGVSPNFVRRLIWDNELTHTRLGRAVRVPARSVAAYAERQTIGSKPA